MSDIPPGPAYRVRVHTDRDVHLSCRMHVPDVLYGEWIDEVMDRRRGEVRIADMDGGLVIIPMGRVRCVRIIPDEPPNGHADEDGGVDAEEAAVGTAEPSLMTPQQLSEYLEVPTQTLSNWRWRNEGPKWSKAGRHVRYRVADVERWLDSQAQGGAA